WNLRMGSLLAHLGNLLPILASTAEKFKRWRAKEAARLLQAIGLPRADSRKWGKFPTCRCRGQLKTGAKIYRSASFTTWAPFSTSGTIAPVGERFFLAGSTPTAW